jgi:hypothetical protein|nr:MAG TPA: structural protein [Caudoviricetes sp.]
MKGVIKNMKEQFLNLSGLTELVTYIKLCIAQHKMIIPRASFSLFPKTGDENNIYIDTSTNSIYRWNDSDKSFVLLAKPPRNISISEGKNNGQITLKVDEIESNATVHGLKSAAFSNASSFATSAQGAKADSAIQSITIAPGTNNGTVKITVNGVTTDNIKVAGLGSAAFSDIAVFAPAKHTHSKSDVGLGNVDNTADIDKSVKYAGSSGSSNTVVYTALTNTDLNTLQTEGKWYYAGGGNTCTNVPVESAAFELYVGRNASVWRYQQFTVTSGEIYIRVFDSSNWGNWRKLAFTSDTVTAASSVPWSGITGKPSTYTPSSHTHTVSQISDFSTHVYDATISRTANTVLAAPNGKAGSASFRALVAADIPSITKSKITDFPSSLPASDVYAWAKASSKPSYSWGEITGKPSTYTPSSHNHTVIQGTSSTSAVPGKANDGFCEFYYNVNNGLANNMPSSNNANAIISISRHAGDYTSQLGFSSNGNLYYREGVGATAWKTILTSSNYTSYTVTKTGGGASGTWGINITGSAGSCTGNAATASNASKVNGHTVNSDVPSGAKFTDTNTWRPLGTTADTACAGNDNRLSNARPASDVYSWAKASSKPSYSWSEITSKPSTFTPASHTHAYIPLSGGTITGSIIRSSGGSWISARNNVAVRGTATTKDSWNPVVGQATPNGYWTIGNLVSNDNLAFSYTSNTNYNAGNNSATTVYLPVQEGTIITSATIGSQSVKYATSAGSAGSVAWGNVSGKPSSYTPSSHTHDDRYYTETEINTKLGAKLGAVSANGYYGMARPDGNTSDWIRTTTTGIIPYQSGGAGGGHCGLGTSLWYFSNAYIDTVNCVNASVSGHIDAAGYIQSSNLINTYFEYQSNRGTIDWRFGSATATGDENFFGFYDAKTGKIPLALDGNFGNIYVGFNVGGLNQKTSVGVYLGAQVSGNRAFIYHGDSYAGSIWIQTRLDGSWKWFSLGRACSTALSDIRLKGNIRDTEVEDATKVIESMKIRSFERKDSHKKYKIGFIADELEQLDPNLVDGGGEVDGHPYYKSVNNLQMLAYVVKGMQELNSKVTILEKENKRLKQKLNMCN